MQNPLKNRKRRSKATRAKIAGIKCVRLSVHRTNSHIYAQLIDSAGCRVLASASTLEPAVRKKISCGGNVSAATLIGKRIAEKAKGCGVDTVAFDRSGYKYHGRVKALADAARESGLKF